MPVAGNGRIVNQAELSAIWGKTPQTIRTWERRGCPVEKRGGGGSPSLYNTADVAAWREDQAALAASGDVSKVDMEEARRRKIAAEAALAELDLSVRQGEVVYVADVAAAVGSEYAEVRAKLLTLPSDMADTLENMSRNEIHEALASKVSEILHVLSRDDEFATDDGLAPGEVEQLEAAPEVEPRGVGGRVSSRKSKELRPSGAMEDE